MISMTDCSIRVNNHVNRIEQVNQQVWVRSFERKPKSERGIIARLSALVGLAGVRRPAAQGPSALTTQPA
jgi:hypothetical protein